MAVRIDRETFLKGRSNGLAITTATRRWSTQLSISGEIRCLDHPVRLIVITPERHLQTTGGCKYCLRRYRQQAMEASVNVAAVEGPGQRTGSRL